MVFTFRKSMKDAFHSRLQEIINEKGVKMNQWQYDFEGDQATIEVLDSILDQLSEDEIQELKSIK